MYANQDNFPIVVIDPVERYEQTPLLSGASAFDIQPILNDIFEPAQVRLIKVGVVGDSVLPQDVAGLVAIHEDPLSPMSLVTRVAPEVVEPQDVLIDLFMSRGISCRTHRGLDDREVLIEPIRGEDLVVTGIGHRTASELGIPSRTPPDSRDRRSRVRYTRLGFELSRSARMAEGTTSSLADGCRYPIRGLIDSTEDVIESRGRFAADGGALRMARRGVQGVALARRDEVGEHEPGVGIHDGQLAIQMVADEGRNHDVEGTAAVESLQSRSKMSRQFLQACVIGLTLKQFFRLMIVCSWHGPSLLFSS